MFAKNLKIIRCLRLRHDFSSSSKGDLIQTLANLAKQSSASSPLSEAELALSDNVLNTLKLVSDNFDRMSFKKNFEVV